MLTRSRSRQLMNFARFMSCGKGNGSDKSDWCDKISETQSERECGTRENVCDDEHSEEHQDNDWKTKFCKTPKRFSTSAVPEIDLSDPCGKQCKPPPPPEPEESYFCYEDIEFCPPTEEIRRRYKLWKLVSLLTIPIIGLTLSFVLPAHRKSQKELEEKIQNSEYVPYPYMHRITKPWWWGDGHHGLFFNPKVNKVPPEFDQSIPKGENKCRNGSGNEFIDENENGNDDDNDSGNHNDNGNHYRNGYPYGNGNGNGIRSRNGKNNNRKEN